MYRNLTVAVSNELAKSLGKMLDNKAIKFNILFSKKEGHSDFVFTSPEHVAECRRILRIIIPIN
jgi:hypothetical protein